jgi:hypothetical protein
MRKLFTDINGLTDRLFYNSKGQMAISAIFGFAFALMFQRVCKDKKCIVIQAPNINEMTSKTYEFEGNCYKYNTKSVSCPKDESVVTSI